MQASKIGLYAFFFGILLQANPCRAETILATISELSVPACGSDKIETDKDGNITVWFNREGSNEIFCNTVAKILVPMGYRLQTGLTSMLTVGARLYNSDDKIYLLLKVQSADLVDKTLRSLTLTADRPSLSVATLSGEVILPEIGSCLKVREAYLAFASTAKLVKATGDSPLTGSLLKLEIPALKLTKLDCNDEPSSISAPSSGR